MKLSSQEKLQEYSDQIEIILSVISAPLWGILKYYERVCEDFFGKIKKVTQEDIDIFVNKLENITSDLHNIENELYKLSHNQKNLVNFYLNNIQLSLKKINLFKKAAYIEAQKWGFKISHNKIKKLLQEINRLQNEIYWPEISSNPVEVNEILSSFSTLYYQNSFVLWENEKFQWEKLIKTTWAKQKQNTPNIETNISFDSKKEIIQKSLDIYWLFDWQINLEDSNWSIRVNWERKEIIIPIKRLQSIPIKKLLQLIDHEIWVHILRSHNSEQTINRKLEWYLESEEWYASLAEILFDENINSISYNSTDHHHKTYLAELFWGDEYRQYLKIYLKLTNPTADEKTIEQLFITAFQRSKRFVSYDFPWANRKDVSYSRWLYDIINYLQQQENQAWFTKTFYSAKSSLKNMDEAAEIAKLFPDAKLKYPLWIWKIVYKKLLWEKIFLSSLQEEDFRFQEIEKLELSTKRNIVEILQNIRGKKSSTDKQ